jgi:hypothetical protein
MEKKVSLDDKSSETINMLADVFDDLQSALEPIRDKALDERARLVGYAQCAEQMIKIIADQVIGLRAIAKKKSEETETAQPVLKIESKTEATKPGRTRTKVIKEAPKGGDNSA